MLIDFTIKNYQAFKNEVSLNMLAASTVKECEDENNTIHNVWKDNTCKLRVLKTAAIYGANGSGKSTILKAMTDFRWMILKSFIEESYVKTISQQYFKFSITGAKTPISMQMIFMVDTKRYRIGFEILDGKILTEWLYVLKENSIKESYCYKREGSTIKVNPKEFKGASGISSKTRGNALFISTCAQFNVIVAMEIKEWFRKRFNILSGSDDTLKYTARFFMNNKIIQNRIINIVNCVDECIKNIDVTEQITESSGNKIDINNGLIKELFFHFDTKKDIGTVKEHKLDIFTSHDVYDNNEIVNSTTLSFQHESLGTRRLFSLLGPWFDTLQNGGVLIIDEYGTSLHTQLSIELLKLFSNISNKHCAQLIFTTHDTNLLRRDFLRRDQIWFTEKDRFGISDLYSLVEYKINQATSVRNDASFEKDYLNGRYGAIPYFGNIPKFIAEYGSEEEN